MWGEVPGRGGMYHYIQWRPFTRGGRGIGNSNANAHERLAKTFSAALQPCLIGGWTVTCKRNSAEVKIKIITEEEYAETFVG
jgi:hypothetical protein